MFQQKRLLNVWIGSKPLAASSSSIIPQEESPQTAVDSDEKTSSNCNGNGSFRVRRATLRPTEATVFANADPQNPSRLRQKEIPLREPTPQIDVYQS